MKKYIVLAFLLLTSLLGFGQVTSTFSCNGTTALTAINTYCQNPNGTFILPSGTDTHNLYIIPEGTPGTITVLIQGSVKGDFTDAVTCGTSSTTTPNLLSCSGIYAKVRAKLTVFTGFTSVNLTYVGTSTVSKKGSGSGTVTSIAATLPIVVTPNPITGAGTVSCPTCATGGSIASTTAVLKGNGSGSAVASTVIDGGTTYTETPQGLSTELKGLAQIIPNDNPGTVTNDPVCVHSNGKAYDCAVADTTLIAGVAIEGAGTTGNVRYCITQCPANFDNASTINHTAIKSTTTTGFHDTGGTSLTPGVDNFIVNLTTGGAGISNIDVMTPRAFSAQANGIGGKTTVQVNGSASQPIINFQVTTPSAPAGNTNCTWQSSNSGNTTSASCYVPTTLSTIIGTTSLASGTLGTILTNTCVIITTVQTGVLTTDNIIGGFNGNTDAVTGYVPGAMLTIKPYPTSGNVNFSVCNNTSSSVTPTTITINWVVFHH